MKLRRGARLAVLSFSMVIVILPGCGSTGPQTEYGMSRGASLNGTAALAELLRSRGHTVRAADRLTETRAEWADGMVRFAPYPGPPEAEEARWLCKWLDEDQNRWLIYVVRDFDATAEYWAAIRDGMSESGDHVRRAQAEANQIEAADWVDKLPLKPWNTGKARDWFAVERGASPPKVCTKLEGPWAKGIDATGARLWLHEAIVADSDAVLLSGDGKPLVVDKSLVKGRNILVVANGSFLLNEALVNAERRSLALRVAEWPGGKALHIAFVEGSYVLSAEAEMPSLWDLMQRLPILRWVGGQMLLAALLAALARAQGWAGRGPTHLREQTVRLHTQRRSGPCLPRAAQGLSRSNCWNATVSGAGPMAARAARGSGGAGPSPCAPPEVGSAKTGSLGSPEQAEIHYF